jgi:hypothetical protein
MCFYYDAVLGSAINFDYLLYAGKEFENTETWIKSWKDMRFSGCSGFNINDKGTNNRYPSSYVIQQAQANENGGIDIKKVGEYAPLEAVLFKFDKPWAFPMTGSEVPPNRIIENWDCLYPEDGDEVSDDGRMVAFIVCFLIVLVVAIITFIIWKRWWRVPIVPLNERHELSFNDMVLMGTVVVDIF